MAVKLSKKKDDNCKVMAVKYWLEAADQRHRYGTLLVPYYKAWMASGSQRNFFYWLDEGAGKELDLVDSPRQNWR